jgi:hypothetical protein
LEISFKKTIKTFFNVIFAQNNKKITQNRPFFDKNIDVKNRKKLKTSRKKLDQIESRKN